MGYLGTEADDGQLARLRYHRKARVARPRGQAMPAPRSGWCEGDGRDSACLAGPSRLRPLEDRRQVVLALLRHDSPQRLGKGSHDLPCLGDR